ncbi:acyltransferase [Bacillus nakamurai]|uniref:Acetyltransferase n=1 Tax=Bacillus nakamurai TaxID=1793963 RepID=A0A150FAL2_9BACI|nr:acyltransferase [Bacillus nakamurai]KXZ22349.1 acetyltransferase [Bacillus nakamurai]MED1228429.1 acyltransferase [Bacillus nakamurai]
MYVKHSNCFFVIRLFAALCVLIGHATRDLNISVFGYTPESKAIFHTGISIFFFLSAFFLFTSYERSKLKGQNVTDFYWSRIIRIAPAVYTYAIVSTVLLIVLGALSFTVFTTKEYWIWLLSNLVLYPQYFPDIFHHIGVGRLNDSLWTIPVQISFYLVLPALYWSYKRFGFKKMILCSFAISAFSVLISFVILKYSPDSITGSLYLHSFLPQMFYFTLGIFWAKAWNKLPQHTVLFLFSVILFSFFKTDPLHLSSINSTLWSFLWFVPLSYAIVWFGYNGPKILWQLNRLDDISMGIFIWHMVMTNVFLYTGINKTLSDYPLIIFLIAATAAVALLSYRLVEKPALRLRSIKTNKPVKTKIAS